MPSPNACLPLALPLHSLPLTTTAQASTTCIRWCPACRCANPSRCTASVPPARPAPAAAYQRCILALLHPHRTCNRYRSPACLCATLAPAHPLTHPARLPAPCPALLQVVMQRLMSSFWLPPTAVLEWLEQHTQIRWVLPAGWRRLGSGSRRGWHAHRDSTAHPWLAGMQACIGFHAMPSLIPSPACLPACLLILGRLSILLTYLFGKSEAFLWVMRRVSGIARAARTALQPVAAALGPPLAMAAQALRLAGGQAWQALAGAVLAVTLRMLQVAAGACLCGCPSIFLHPPRQPAARLHPRAAAVVTTVGAVLHAGLAPMATLLLEFWLAIGALLLPLVQVSACWLQVWKRSRCGMAWPALACLAPEALCPALNTAALPPAGRGGPAGIHVGRCTQRQRGCRSRRSRPWRHGQSGAHGGGRRQRRRRRRAGGVAVRAAGGCAGGAAHQRCQGGQGSASGSQVLPPGVQRGGRWRGLGECGRVPAQQRQRRSGSAVYRAMRALPTPSPRSATYPCPRTPPAPPGPPQMCENVVRHRLTLELRAGRAWRRAKAAALAAATAPLRLAAELIKYLIIAARLLLLDRIEAGHRAVQAREAAAAAAAAGNTGGAGGAGAGEEAANAGRGPLQQAVPPGQEREMAAAGTAGCVLAGQPASSKKDN